MPNHEENQELLNHFSDQSRQASLVGSTVVLPKILDDEGEIRNTWASPDAVFKLNLKQARFLKAYEETLDLEKAALKADVTVEWAKKFLKNQTALAYLDEKQRLTALSEVATPQWTKAKLVDGITGHWVPENPKVAVKCLEMVKDINFPRAAANLNITQNVFNLPKLTPDAERALKEIADREADVIDAEVA